MLVSSSAPLPNNTLTPIPQSWVDQRNAAIGLFSLRAAQALAITNCFTPAGGFAESVGPYTAAEVAQSQASSPAAASAVAGATIPSAAGTSPAVASITSAPGSAPSIVNPPPQVLPYNNVSLQALGLPPPGRSSSCNTGQALTYKQRMNQPQPKMLMPKTFPHITEGSAPGPGLGAYAPAWGTARRGASCSNGGGEINWGGAVIALAVAFGIVALMES